jgi:hypothetical protein
MTIEVLEGSREALDLLAAEKTDKEPLGLKVSRNKFLHTLFHVLQVLAYYPYPCGLSSDFLQVKILGLIASEDLISPPEAEEVSEDGGFAIHGRMRN